MNSVRSNNISLKYQRFTTLGSKDIGIRKSEFVAKTHVLCVVKERERMMKVNEMFEKLKTIVPEGIHNPHEDKETKVCLTKNGKTRRLRLLWV